MKFSFAHIVGIISGGLAAIAGLNPALVAAIYPPAVPYAAAGIAAAGALVNLIHAVSGGTKTATVSVAAKMLPLAFVAMFVGSSLSGCASIESFLSSPDGKVAAVAAVDVAVATAEAKGVTAAQINSVAKQALAADTGVSGTLAAVSTLVNVQIAKLNLPAGDLAAVNILEVALQAEIQSRIGANQDLATAQAAVADVLNAVIAATGG